MTKKDHERLRKGLRDAIQGKKKEQLTPSVCPQCDAKLKKGAKECESCSYWIGD